MQGIIQTEAGASCATAMQSPWPGYCFLCGVKIVQKGENNLYLHRTFWAGKPIVVYSSWYISNSTIFPSMFY